VLTVWLSKSAAGGNWLGNGRGKDSPGEKIRVTELGRRVVRELPPEREHVKIRSKLFFSRGGRKGEPCPVHCSEAEGQRLLLSLFGGWGGGAAVSRLREGGGPRWLGRVGGMVFRESSLMASGGEGPKVRGLLEGGAQVRSR